MAELSKDELLKAGAKKYEIIVTPDGTKKWVIGEKIQDQEPPIVKPDGRTCYYVNGVLERTDGPAVIYPENTREWHMGGLLHREDGPAIEYGDGRRAWWVNGVEYTEQAFNNRVVTPKHEGEVIEVDGVLYTLVSVKK